MARWLFIRHKAASFLCVCANQRLVVATIPAVLLGDIRKVINHVGPRLSVFLVMRRPTLSVNIVAHSRFCRSEVREFNGIESVTRRWAEAVDSTMATAGESSTLAVLTLRRLVTTRTPVLVGRRLLVVVGLVVQHMTARWLAPMMEQATTLDLFKILLLLYRLPGDRGLFVGGFG